MHIFSFCIYGSSPKYCKGLLKNIEYIATAFPEFETWIAVGDDVPESYTTAYQSFPRVRLFHYPFHDGRLMTYRFFFIDGPEVECMLVRDADSRITPRDEWCIRRFLDRTGTNAARIFSIRDHCYHGREIMGGQWGIFKISGLHLEKEYEKFKLSCTDIAAYNSDQEFLRCHLYLPYKHLFVAYTSTHRFPDEQCEPIGIERLGPHDFCGNVINFKENGEEHYEFTFW
jgi:hypothetical protein